MTAFSEHTFLSQHEDSTKQIKMLKDAIDEKTRKLNEVQQERLRVEEDTMKFTKETNRRVELIMEKSEVVDLLQQLGQILQEEKRLCEQLNQVSADRDLEESRERFRAKATCVAAEIVEVKRHLAEVKASNMTAQALIQAPSSKSKRNQSKLK